MGGYLAASKPEINESKQRCSARTVQLKTANDDEVCFGVENEGEVEMWCGILWCLGDLAVRRKGGSKSKR